MDSGETGIGSGGWIMAGWACSCPIIFLVFFLFDGPFYLTKWIIFLIKLGYFNGCFMLQNW
jgi:hypothetical protein